MNIDEEIFYKTLANQSHYFINRVIIHDQVAFIPGKESYTDIQKNTINVIQYIMKLKKKPYHCVSRCLKKSFVTVQYPLTRKVSANQTDTVDRF